MTATIADRSGTPFPDDYEVTMTVGTIRRLLDVVTAQGLEAGRAALQVTAQAAVNAAMAATRERKSVERDASGRIVAIVTDRVP